jgi:hypothetical protein
MPLETASAKSMHWLNRRRLSSYGLILALCLWSVYAWLVSTAGLLDRNGLLKGTDFLHFYVLGTLASQHRGADLYDVSGQSELAHQRVPEAGELVYIPMYPPQVSLLFAPLARFTYGTALTLWLAFSTAIYFLCCYLVWRTCPGLQNYASTVTLVALAFPGFFHLVLWGQSSGLALLCFTLAYLALRSRRNLLAGLAIGSLIFKPPLGLAAAFVFLLAAEWKVVAGAVISSTIQLSVGWVYYGFGPLRDYGHRVLHMREILPLFEPRPYQMHSLRAFWELLLPNPIALGLYVVSALCVLVLALRCWRSGALLGLRYGVLLFATVLVAPHLTIYDLVVLAPAFLLLGEWLVQRAVPADSIVVAMLVIAYLLPLIPQARWTHLQVSVIAMTVLVWRLARGAASFEGTPAG